MKYGKRRYSCYVLVASCLLFLAVPAVAEDDMPANGRNPSLTDADLQAVLIYLRQSFE